MDAVEFAADERPSADELLEFYQRHGHPNRPGREQVSRMIDASFCFVTARAGGRLIGFARGVTDGLVGRLAECKLDPTYQGPAAITRKDARIEHDESGIAAQMARRVLDALWEYGVERIDAVAYGTEVDFCEELGFKKLSGVVALGLPCADRSKEPQLAGAKGAYAGVCGDRGISQCVAAEAPCFRREEQRAWWTPVTTV